MDAASRGSDALDSENRSGSVIACAISTMILSGIAVAARFYTRGSIKKVLGKEDWTLLVAWILSVGYTGAIISECRFALGRHIWTVSEENMRLYRRATWFTTLFYYLSPAFSKISILLLFIRVLTYDYARRIAYFMLAVVIVYNTLSFVSTITMCRPLEAFWDSRIKGASCNPRSFMWAHISLHILTDFLIFLIPMPVVFTMTLPLKQKILLLHIFALGFFVCLISILRTIWISNLISRTDFTYEYATIANWSAVELHSAILVPCLIVLKPLVTKYWPRVLSSGGCGDGDASVRGRPASFAARPTATGKHDDAYGSEAHIAMSSRSLGMYSDGSVLQSSRGVDDPGK